jgi:hypothetical protein
MVSEERIPMRSERACWCVAKKFPNLLCHSARRGDDAALPIADRRGRNSNLCRNVCLQPVQFQAVFLDLLAECLWLQWDLLI